MTQEITADLREHLRTPDAAALAELHADVERTVRDVLRPAALPAPRPEAKGGAVWPRNRYADWAPHPIPTADQPPADMLALTVFTSYVLDAGPGRPSTYAATCVCGEVWHSTSDALMRQQLGEHRCVEQLDRPGAPLLPPSRDVDTADDALLDRVLDGLRRLP